MKRVKKRRTARSLAASRRMWTLVHPHGTEYRVRLVASYTDRGRVAVFRLPKAARVS